ncbi:MAG: DUF502 domain-containing protein [Phycisphaerae bacterium]|nr:DUF502 domain-containing protein [Phycisphaerae bacterium]
MTTKPGGHFRRFFLRGLAAVLPTALTIGLIVWVFSKIQQYFGNYINKGAAYVTTRAYVWITGMSDPDAISRLRVKIIVLWDHWLFWFGFVLAVLGVYFFGRFLASFFGRIVWRLIEKALIQLPIVKQVYPSIKQVTDFLLAERKLKVSKVVAVEYPRKGIWSLGLVTGRGMGTLEETLKSDLVTVFIPSSPTPITGYTITIRQDEVIDLPLSLDDALRFTISGGVILPPGQKVGGGDLPPPETSVYVDERQEGDD